MFNIESIKKNRLYFVLLLLAVILINVIIHISIKALVLNLDSFIVPEIDLSDPITIMFFPFLLAGVILFKLGQVASIFFYFLQILIQSIIIGFIISIVIGKFTDSSIKTENELSVHKNELKSINKLTFQIHIILQFVGLFRLAYFKPGSVLIAIITSSLTVFFTNKFILRRHIKRLSSIEGGTKIRRNDKIISSLLIIGFVALGISSLGLGKKLLTSNYENRTIESLGDISYSKYAENDYTIYIRENNELTPYLLVNKEGGKVLLLRKYLINDITKFIPEKTNSYYVDYRNSNIDNFLNSEFTDRFSPYLSSQIINGNIPILTREFDKVTKDIIIKEDRKVFLLSLGDISDQGDDGKVIDYFKDENSKTATDENGTELIQWLRTPYLYGEEVYIIGYDGVMGSLLIPTASAQYLGGFDYDKNVGIRPAFYLPSEIPIKVIDIEGKEMFIIFDDF